MKILALLLGLFAATRVIRRKRANEELTTQSGEPITEEALMTDVDQSITPERE